MDAWSIYCPYPKKYRISTSIKGVFLGCKPTENGMVRCCWTEDEVGNKVYLSSDKISAVEDYIEGNNTKTINFKNGDTTNSI